MNEKTSRRTSRTLLVVALLLATVVAFGAGYNRAEAIAFDGPYVCSYYNNAAHSTVVGARGIGCCGSIISWGVTSKYSVCQPLYCTDVICPN